MATAIMLKHPSGVTKVAYEGFSWTCFFFGLFPPLFRGDFKWAGITLLIGILGSFLLFIPNLVWWIVLSVQYNEWHKNDLLMQGFVKQ